MIASSFDQQAWLDRIGYNGAREPSLETLHQLKVARARCPDGLYETLGARGSKSSNAPSRMPMVAGLFTCGAAAAPSTQL